jgi:prepilin-type N-terminal cleavage/methylation domain-containing protein
MTLSKPLLNRQKGMTLIELMVAMVISLIASMAMVMLMANTLGTGTRTIGMTRLTQELRTAMQIISRDLRRANYLNPAAARACYANPACLADAGFGGKMGAVVVGSGSDSLSFWVDRQGDGFDACDQGAFRLNESSGIGTIQMLTCGGDWVEITDPDIIDVQSFVVDNSDTYTDDDINDSGAFQTVQKIRLSISADLRNATGPGFTISRVIGDQIRIRNNYITP